MKRMLKLVPFLAIVISFGCSLFGKQIPLIVNGASSYSIVVSINAARPERYAAEELQDFLLRISGCRLPIVTDDTKTEGPLIAIGDSRIVRNLLPQLKLNNFGNEEFIVRTVDDNLVVAGGRPRGTLYGIYSFLEGHLGCRWYTADIARVPHMKSIMIRPIDERQAPAFEYREVYFREAADRNWAVRNKVNGSHMNLDETVGGQVKYSHFVHTFYQLVPPKKYFATHPEYFSLINGKRIGTRAQLCLTNPQVIRIATDTVLKWIDESPDANIFSISQNDWEGWCECPTCSSLDEKEGSHAGTVINFVNAIADAVGEKHSDKFFSTLAYTYTQKPPASIRPHKNVIVRLCHMNPSCDSHPLAKCGRNSKYLRHLNEWSEITDKLYVWHYVTDFTHYLMPFPNFNAIREDIPTYHKAGVRGMFCQGNFTPGGGGEMAELRSYVLAKLLWNPGIDVDATIDDFLGGVYGAAGKPIRQYFNMLHEKVKSDTIHLDLYSDIDAGHLTPEILQQARQLFDEAESLAPDPEILKRVQKARLPMYYADLSFQAVRHMNEDVLFDPQMVNAFNQVVRNNGISSYREGNDMDKLLKLFSDDCRFVRNWWIIGPFECPHGRGLQTVLPPEREIILDRTYDGVGNNKISWQKWPNADMAHIDFTKTFELDSIGVAYALTYILSPSKIQTEFGVGSNDGVRVWLNDKLIHDNPAMRQAHPNEDVIEVVLSPGWNKVLVKVDQAGRNWGMYFSVIDTENQLKFGYKPSLMP